MAVKYKTYSRYKDSEDERLSYIPQSWDRKKLKFLAKIKNGQDYKSIEVDTGYPVLGSGGQFTASSKYLYDRPSVLLGRKGTVDKPIYIDEPFWTVDTMYYTEIKNEIPEKFFYYLCLTIPFGKYITSTALPSMTQENLSNNIFYIPINYEEKQNIANFLDYETSKMDMLIEKQQQLIKLLEEKREAVISHAVTKGLNPNVSMKDSGVEWLGEIPEHWETLYSKWLFKERNTKATKNDEQLTASQKYGVISQKEFMELESQKVTQVILNPGILKYVKSGDFVISMRSFQGGIEYSPYSGSISSAYVPLYPIQKIDTLYFKYLFKSRPYIQALQSTSNLIRDGQALRYNNFIQIPLPIVSIQEQREIGLFLESEITKINQLINKAIQSIELLKERRTALISAAVTGKIDVRDWQAPTVMD